MCFWAHSHPPHGFILLKTKNTSIFIGLTIKIIVTVTIGIQVVAVCTRALTLSVAIVRNGIYYYLVS